MARQDHTRVAAADADVTDNPESRTRGDVPSHARQSALSGLPPVAVFLLDGAGDDNTDAESGMGWCGSSQWHVSSKRKRALRTTRGPTRWAPSSFSACAQLVFALSRDGRPARSGKSSARNGSGWSFGQLRGRPAVPSATAAWLWPPRTVPRKCLRVRARQCRLGSGPTEGKP
jgi:hypothetical protein